MSLRLGIDLGGTNVRVGLVDEKGTILEIIQEPTEAEKGHIHTINKMKQMIESLVKGNKVKGIGIGAPGPLDIKNGVILSPPNLPGWDEIPLVKIFEEHFEVEVFLNNDANVAGLAEANAGSGAGHESVYYMTVSTGIGGALIINKQLFNGANGYAGEIGNMIIEPDGYKHNNLNRGALEGLASGTSIGRRAYEEFGIEGGAKQVFHLAKQGNKEAQLIIDETVKFLAIGIANITHVVNPDLFVVGGGVMESKQFILTPLKDKVKEFVYPQLASSIKIVPTALGGQAGVIGAAMLVR
ncbi:glucokinase [Metabacillus crassostreae]|uniref:ROK family protein n=1 Tax=Metabacillus crassostreae TaxID=929098 RepID=UPI00195CA3DD|nr:ROK family protein [Metabacillus crassostreae]MBM7603969.1 glucokinase [Metabacillus crassostreae]